MSKRRRKSGKNINQNVKEKQNEAVQPVDSVEKIDENNSEQTEIGAGKDASSNLSIETDDLKEKTDNDTSVSSDSTDKNNSEQTETGAGKNSSLDSTTNDDSKQVRTNGEELVRLLSEEENDSKQTETMAGSSEDDDIILEDASDNKGITSKEVEISPDDENADIDWVDVNGDTITESVDSASVAVESLAEIERDIKERAENGELDEDDYVPKKLSFFGYILRFLVIALAFVIVFLGVQFCKFIKNVTDDASFRTERIENISFKLNSQYGVSYNDNILGILQDGKTITSISENQYSGIAFDKALKNQYGEFTKTKNENYSYYVLEDAENVDIIYLFKDNYYIAFNISSDIEDTSKYYKSFSYKGIKINLEEEYVR